MIKIVTSKGKLKTFLQVLVGSWPFLKAPLLWCIIWNESYAMIAYIWAGESSWGEKVVDIIIILISLTNIMYICIVTTEMNTLFNKNLLNWNFRERHKEEKTSAHKIDKQWLTLALLFFRLCNITQDSHKIYLKCNIIIWWVWKKIKFKLTIEFEKRIKMNGFHIDNLKIWFFSESFLLKSYFYNKFFS